MQTYTNKQINEIIYELKSDKVLLTQTDTVFGLLSLDYKKIYKLKKRDPKKKLILFISSLYKLDLPVNYVNVLQKYLPGKLTFIWKKIAYRIPNVKLIIDLVNNVGPIYSSSANISGQDPIEDFNCAAKIFANNNFDLFFVNNTEVTWQKSKPSTIINLDNMTILRQGDIDGQQIIKKIKEQKN